MPNYKAYNYDQSTLVVINFEDQIQPGTFEHAIHYLIDERLDLSVFDPRYQNDQKEKYGLRHPGKGLDDAVIPATEFDFDPMLRTCVCPNGKPMWFRGERVLGSGVGQVSFEGRLTDCRRCPIKTDCMKNPESANTRQGHGRQVSFTIKSKRKNTATDWMKRRVDSQKGKQIYSHRMSVVEPVFGNIGTNKGLNRFSLRGKSKVNGQSQLFCLIQNVEKLMRYGNLEGRAT